jgi:hypothetical protein
MTLFERYEQDILSLQALGFDHSKGKQVFEAFIQTVSQDAVNALKRVYQRWLNKNLTISCRNCIFDGYLELIFIKNQKTYFMQKTFKLMKGIYLTGTSNHFPMLHGEHEHDCTVVNCTDELAVYHLALDKGKAKYFETLPEDWEQQADKKRKEIEDKYPEYFNINADKKKKAVNILDEANADELIIKTPAELEAELDAAVKIEDSRDISIDDAIPPPEKKSVATAPDKPKAKKKRNGKKKK